MKTHAQTGAGAERLEGSEVERDAGSVSLVALPCRVIYARWAAAVGVLMLGLSVWLYRLADYALHNELYSHVLLIPVLSGYFVWRKRRRLPVPRSECSILAIGLGAAGAIAICGLVLVRLGGTILPLEDELCLSTTAAVLLFVAITVWLLGLAFARTVAFPLAFLVLAIPLPAGARENVETLLQIGSSDAAFIMFRAVGMPVYHDGFVFQLPGTSLEVAPECSGIHSTIALFLTSLVAGHLFLSSSWRRSLLAILVVPIAIARNGFRVFTLGELCVHFGPQMLDSPIHRHGGPLFFLLSLIPLVAALVWLVQSERAHVSPACA